MLTQENKKYDDYIKAGITCKIIECVLPSFIWNIDEKKIVYPDMFRIVEKDGINILELNNHPGNMRKNVKTYTELSQELISEINSNYGIVFLPNHETVNHSRGINYRFISVE